MINNDLYLSVVYNKTDLDIKLFSSLSKIIADN